MSFVCGKVVYLIYQLTIKLRKMKKVFELAINGSFIQHLLPSEVKLLKWEEGKTYQLTPVYISIKDYNIFFGINKSN